MKKLGVPAIAAAVYSTITLDQWIALLAAIITLLNVILEILKTLRERKRRQEEENH